MKKSLAAIIVLSLLFNSCFYKHIKGDGNITSKEVAVTSFTELNVAGNITVYLLQEETTGVKIQADENLLPYIEVEQDGDKVTIKNKDGYNLESTDDMRIYVSAPAFHKISVSGAGDVIAENKITVQDGLDISLSGAGGIKMDVDANTLSASVSGVGSINLSGQVQTVNLDINGAGDANCYGLQADDATVSVSGVGDVKVYAGKKLDANVSGTGSIHYKGNPDDVKQQVSGTGSVVKE